MTIARTTTRLVALAGLLSVPFSTSAAAGDGDGQGYRASHQQAAVSWHPQQASAGNTGVVEGAHAALTRQHGGASYRFHARDLTPGNAYTLWLITVNNPDACAGTPCTGPELFLDEVDAQVRFGTGHVVGEDGAATFAGHVTEGTLDGWLPDRSLDDATTAQIMLTLNDHGPAIAEHMPGMIRTYRGGCSDASPFPGIFPDTALADGEPGPNTCLLSQSAAFPAE